MLAFIRANYKNGDTILINCTAGAIEGKIAFVSQDSIVLRLPNNMIYGIAASDITSFTAASPEKLITADGEFKATEDTNAAQGEESLMMNYANEALNSNKKQNDTAHAENVSLGEVIGIKKDKDTEEDDEVLESLGKEEPQVKVVGKISLEQLNRIDPKGAARRTSQKGYGFNHEAENEDGPDALHKSSQPYVPSMGRITYYNRDKRYGFIHDYKEDIDLYFHIHQVADSNLYERINRGLKVVYTITQKPTGYVAVCIHFPNTVENLLDRADEYIEKGYYDYANGLINHVLTVYPDNADALEMSHEVSDLLPQVKREEYTRPNTTASQTEEGSNVYNPDTLYTTAKRATIMRDYDKAEEYYVKAIEANERLVSSVKDLLQIFVTRFKSVDTEAEREMWHDEAHKVYDKYKDKLPDDISTMQFLAGNFFLPLLDYDIFLDLTSQLLEMPELADDKAKRAFYIWQRALALHKAGRDEEAVAECDKALAIIPYHSQTKNLKKSLLQALKDKEAEGAESKEQEGAANEASSTAEAETAVEPAEHSEPETEIQAEANDTSADEGETSTSAEEASTDESTQEEQAPDDNEGIKKSDEWWDELSNDKAY